MSTFMLEALEGAQRRDDLINRVATEVKRWVVAERRCAEVETGDPAERDMELTETLARQSLFDLGEQLVDLDAAAQEGGLPS